jgi:hypothetical protein
MRPVRPRLSEAQTAEALAVAGKGPPGPWAGHTAGRLLGRGPRASLAGPAPEAGPAARALLPTGGSQGNAGIIRQAPTTGPCYGGGRHDGTQVPIPAPGGATPRDYNTESRTGLAFHNGSTIVYDRHVMSKTGTETQQAHPDSTGGQGLSPLADGPVRPVHMLVDRVMAPRYGNTGTRHLDNTGPFPSTTGSDGRQQPLGIQDGSPYSHVYGGTPGLTHIYGVRGTAGVVSPAPAGSPGDGPQLIRGGPAHGLHSRAQPNAELRTRRFAATPQQKRPRTSLPKNSARAGQSWSQNAQRLGGKPTPAPTVSGTAPGVAGGRLKR